jgi:hypothetical protein
MLMVLSSRSTTANLQLSGRITILGLDPANACLKHDVFCSASLTSFDPMEQEHAERTKINVLLMQPVDDMRSTLSWRVIFVAGWLASIFLKGWINVNPCLSIVRRYS